MSFDHFYPRAFSFSLMIFKHSFHIKDVKPYAVGEIVNVFPNFHLPFNVLIKWVFWGS